MNLPCGCCEGVEALTPGDLANRPGLPSLRYRTGTHGTFFETMQARLSGLSMDISESEGGALAGTVRPLDRLRVRAADDAAIALLDAWASVADVLTFYQERIANEGFLRTATERLSVLELARLVGYRPRPGVSATAHLAFTLDAGYRTQIPAGTRAQNVPAPGETMQAFETAEAFEARTEWNDLQPRRSRPQLVDRPGTRTLDALYLQGTATNLRKGDAVLLLAGPQAADRRLRFVESVEAQSASDRTKVTLQALPAAVSSPGTAGGAGTAATAVVALPSEAAGPTSAPPILSGAATLVAPLSVVPDRPARAVVDPRQRFTPEGDGLLQAITLFRPQVAGALYGAVRSLPPSEPNPLRVYALRVQASPFGFNAPKEPQYEPSVDPTTGHPNPRAGNLMPSADWPDWTPAADEDGNTLFLDAAYNEVTTTGYVAVRRPDEPAPRVRVVLDAAAQPRTAYGISGKTTKVSLDEEWWRPQKLDVETTVSTPPEDSFAILRGSAVYAGSEELAVAEVPMEGDVSEDEIELDDLYEGLEAGRLVIVAGERSIPGFVGRSGVHVAELAVLAGVLQGARSGVPMLPGERVRTTLVLTQPLTYQYRRDTVVVHGNVVRATHGESRVEILGGGDATKSFQAFTIRQFPVTYVAAPTAAGAASTLAVRVNDVLWHEAPALVALGPTDRAFVTRTDDDQRTTVVFGDGASGRRLPTGPNNVTADYRSGIGKPGNVRAGAITLLASKPLGVREVVNPLASSGGADRDSRDQARRNVPTAVMALDRLVSVRDYEDFSRAFAGIGKAAAVRLPRGRRHVVHITIAGVDDVPIAEASDLYVNLVRAIHDLGDPSQSVEVAVREVKLIVLAARVKLDPDYGWTSVEPAIRLALEDAFGFERRELAQSAFASEILAVVQRVRGVVYVDLDQFTGMTDEEVLAQLSETGDAAALFSPTPAQFVSAEPARLAAGLIKPAQLAYITPAIPGALALSEIVG